LGGNCRITSSSSINTNIQSHTPAQTTQDNTKLTLLTIPTPIVKMVTPTTCCGKSGEGCVCAAQAKCSCGAKAALHCTCAKAEAENKVEGPRCSCRARPAGECTCDRAATENATPSGSLCSCGSRPADACTCEKASDGGLLPTETDFTGKA
jgi:hypothetical protein